MLLTNMKDSAILQLKSRFQKFDMIEKMLNELNDREVITPLS